MARMMIGVFSSHGQAESTINHLEDRGYNPKDISIIMKDRSEVKEMSGRTGADVMEGVASGVTTGGVIGGIAGLLIGMGTITVPGIGALLIGGPIAAALGITGVAATTISGAITGALAGGLVGALVSLGVPEEEARVYEDRVKSGAILLAVPVTLENEEEVGDIMESEGAEQIRTFGEDKERRSKQEEEYPTPAYYSEVRKKRDALEEDEDDLL